MDYVQYRRPAKNSRVINRVKRALRVKSNRRKYALARYRKIPMNKIPKSILPEIKKLDLEASQQTVGTITAGTYYQTSAFTNISQGDTVSTRTGQKVFIKYVVINLLMTPSDSATWNSWRVAIHLDKEPAASTYAAGIGWSTMYVDGSTDLLDTLAFPNTTLVGRLKLLKNYYFVRSPHLFSVGGATPVTSVQANPPIHLRVKIPVNKRINFQNGTNEVTSGCKLYLTAWSNQTGAAAPLLNMNARTYFTDA